MGGRYLSCGYVHTVFSGVTVRTHSILPVTTSSDLRDQEHREEELAQLHPILSVGWV